MKTLEESRTLIDEIDNKIIELYEKRMQVVKDVVEYKIENNIPILDANRESSMLSKNLKKINNEEFKKYYEDVLKGYLKASKAMQQDILNLKSKD